MTQSQDSFDEFEVFIDSEHNSLPILPFLAFLTSISLVFTPVGAITMQKIAGNCISGSGDGFGYSSEIDDIYGDSLIVGSSFCNDFGTDSGMAYIFYYNSSTLLWDEPIKLIPNDIAAGDRFGYSVALSGHIALVGAKYDDAEGFNSGSAYIFALNESDGSWYEMQKITASDGKDDEDFGTGVALSAYGEYAVIGANQLSNDLNLPEYKVGKVYVFKNINGTWIETQILTASDNIDGSLEPACFGTDVAINRDGTIIVTGAWLRVPGRSYIFQRNINKSIANNDIWNETQILMPYEYADDEFGWSVDISGNFIIIGNPMYKSYMGVAYIYEKHKFMNGSYGTWIQVMKLEHPSWLPGGQCGRNNAVAIYDDGTFAYALLGCSHDDVMGIEAGAFYFADNTAADGSWIRKEKYFAPNGSAGDRLGRLFINQYGAIVGARGNAYVINNYESCNETRKIANEEYFINWQLNSICYTQSPTLEPTNPTVYPSKHPTLPTVYPTLEPTLEPSNEPSQPTLDPTRDPSIDPTNEPSIDPTCDPSIDPTVYPSVDPSIDPTSDPSIDPSKDPTMYPSFDPSIDPSSDPSSDPSNDPTLVPTKHPTMSPTVAPSISPSASPLQLAELIEQNVADSSNINDAYLYLILFGVPCIVIVFLLIMKATILKHKLSCIATAAVHYFSVILYFLQLFDLYSDVMFCVQLNHYYSFVKVKQTQYEIKEKDIDTFYYLFLFSLIFTILPYIANFASSIRIVANIVSNDVVSTYSKEWLKNNSSIYSIGVLLSGGSYYTLKVINSNFLGLPQLSAGLSKKQIERFAPHKIFLTTLLENIPQMIIQFYFLMVLQVITSIAVVSLILSLFNILLSILTTLVRRTSFGYQKEFPFTVKLLVADKDKKTVYKNAAACARIVKSSEILKKLSTKYNFNFEIMTFSKTQECLYGVVLFTNASVNDIKTFLDENIEHAVSTAFKHHNHHMHKFDFNAKCYYPLDSIANNKEIDRTRSALLNATKLKDEIEMTQVCQVIKINDHDKKSDGDLSEGANTNINTAAAEKLLLEKWKLSQYWKQFEELGYDDHTYWKQLVKNNDTLQNIFGNKEGHQLKFIQFVQQMK